MRLRRKSGATQARTEIWRRGSTSSSSGVSGVAEGGEQHGAARLSSGQKSRARKQHRQKRTAAAAAASCSGEGSSSTGSTDGWTLDPDEVWPGMVDI